MSIEHSIRYYSWRFFSFQSISVCPKYQPSLSKGMLDIMTLLLHSAPRQLRAGWQRQWLWQFLFHNDSDNSNEMRMTKTKTMLVNKDARNSETTHLLHASGHFDPTALSQLAQMPTQMPGLLTQIPKLCPPRCTILPLLLTQMFFTLHCVMSNTHRHNWWATESAIVYSVYSQNKCIETAMHILLRV